MQHHPLNEVVGGGGVSEFCVSSCSYIRAFGISVPTHPSPGPSLLGLSIALAPNSTQLHVRILVFRCARKSFYSRSLVFRCARKSFYFPILVFQCARTSFYSRITMLRCTRKWFDPRILGLSYAGTTFYSRSLVFRCARTSF